MDLDIERVEVTAEEAAAIEYWKYFNCSKAWKQKFGSGLLSFIREFNRQVKLCVVYPKQSLANFIDTLRKMLHELHDILTKMGEQHTDLDFSFIVREIYDTL
jgi:hypothetical protein